MSVKITQNLSGVMAKVEKIAHSQTTLLFVGNEARKLMDDFVPFLEGDLSTNVLVYVEGDKVIIEYVEPYAKKMYYGDGFNFTKDHHPLAGSRWKDAMIEVRGEQLIETVQAFLKRG